MSRSEKISTRSGQEMSRAEVDAWRAGREAKRAARLAGKKAHRTARKKKCQHRGQRTGGADGYSPRGVDCVPLYACQLFGDCTLRRVIGEIACCDGCGKYEQPVAKRAPDPDDGRAG